MKKEEVSKALDAAAHLLCAASAMVMFDDTSRAAAKSLITQARGLVAMAVDLAGEDVFRKERI
jgi:hypothetical protein